MLRDFWNIIRVSFRKRFILYYTIVLSMTFFGAFPSLLVKLVSFAAFIGTSILFVSIFTLQFISNVQALFAYWKAESFPVTYEIKEMSKRMGTPVEEIRFVKGCNAYVIRRSLALGLDLLKILTFYERQAVVAHELGHIKRKHAIIRMVLLISLLAIPIYTWSRLSSPIFFSESITQMILTIMLSIAMLAFAMLATIPINWQVEFDADKIAARFAGKEHMRSALLKLGHEKDLEEPSETHPSIAERVKTIDKLRI